MPRRKRSLKPRTWVRRAYISGQDSWWPNKLVILRKGERSRYRKVFRVRVTEIIEKEKNDA